MFDIKTGVIGVGSMGQHHARVYKNFSKLVGVADLDSIKGKEIAAKFGVKWYSDYLEMLDYVDAVTIAVPTSLHHKVASDVASSGVHMLVEKPLSGNIQDAESIIDFSKKYNVVLAVGHIERYNPVLKNLKSILKGEEILTISARRLSSSPPRIIDVGVLFDLTIHDVDIINYLACSTVDSVHTTGGKFRNEHHEDYVNLTMNFNDGKIGLCETSWLSKVRVRDIDVKTKNGNVYANYLNKEIDINLSKQTSDKNLELEDFEPLQKELEDFLESIIDSREPRVTGNDGLRAVRIVEAGLKSLDSGTEILI